MKLKGKSVIVTGSSQGFGLAATKAFAQEGANVAICARGQEMLRIAQKELARCAMGKAKVIAMPADVANPDDVDRFVKYVVSEFGGVDVMPVFMVPRVPSKSWIGPIGPKPLESISTVLFCLAEQLFPT